MNIKRNKPNSQPINYTGPSTPYGTLPKNHAPNPFWYMQNKGNPMMWKALMSAFQQPGKAIQRKVNHQRRPFDAFRGY